MPAEFEPHEATWLSWPHNPETWPGRMKFIPPVWIQMIKPLHVHETVHVCVTEPGCLPEAGGRGNTRSANSAEGAMTVTEQVQAILRRHDIGRNVILHPIPTNDAWMRDYGPIFVKPLRILDFIFNSWGRKYGPWDLDDEVPKRVAEYLNVPCRETGIVLEGGSIDVNGKGTLLTTEQCLLNKNRNPHLTRLEIEQCLKDYLGVTQILWLGEGIVGDDTDGHVDDIARFVSPKTVVAAVEEDPADPNYKPLQENLQRLRSMRDQDGRPLEVVTIPMPGPVVSGGQRLPASYANFYIANGIVLVPTYRHPNDQAALEVLGKLFPKRRIVGIDCVDLVWGLGAIHCVTQQQPQA